MISRGMRHLELAAEGDEISEYHIQAGIAACHAIVPDYATTDWRRILHLYEMLLAGRPSPVVKLNRAVAMAMTHGPAKGIAAAREMEHHPVLQTYPLLPATPAELHRQLGDAECAAAHLRQALAIPWLSSRPIEFP